MVSLVWVLIRKMETYSNLISWISSLLRTRSKAKCFQSLLAVMKEILPTLSLEATMILEFKKIISYLTSEQKMIQHGQWNLENLQLGASKLI
jgi:hypothetical protein